MLKILDDVCMPTKGSKYSAAIDLYAREDILIGAGETVKVPLGVCIDLEEWLEYNDDEFQKAHYGNNLGFIDSEFDEYVFEEFKSSHYLQLEPRSSLRAKGLIAGSGIIDLDYKDEIMIILHNPLSIETFANYLRLERGQDELKAFDKTFTISKGDKIAQILLKEHKTYLIGIDTEEERIGGFGSTDK